MFNEEKTIRLWTGPTRVTNWQLEEDTYTYPAISEVDLEATHVDLPLFLDIDIEWDITSAG